MLLKAFQDHITTSLPFLENSKLLLAVSGGLDSMVLLQLCTSLDWNNAVAHCNFSLRDTESDGDTDFVKEVCKNIQVQCFTKVFDTVAFAKANKRSTQVAARELRYNWFKELAVQERFDYILTAHHANDSLETFIINLSRGTGLDGLTGIPETSGTVVRPLLPFSRKQLQEYATVNNLQWREDSSNASDKYMRNSIRHHVVPALEDVRPDVLDRFLDTQAHLQQSSRLLEVYAQELKHKYTYPIDSLVGPSGVYILIEKLRQHPEPEAVLYLLLKEYGFTAWDDIYDLINAQPGKQVFSETHRLLKDRETLQLFKIVAKDQELVFDIASPVGIHKGSYGMISFDEVNAFAKADSHQIYVDANRLQLPLSIRKWEQGDLFYPLGFEGKKKLSKYFKDEKLSLVAKENVWLLCSGDAIVWVIGQRADDRFKVTKDTQQILKITYTYDEQNA